MAIFQKSVIKKHLRGLNTVWLNTAYDKFKEIFNPEKIETIIKLKEEEYQDGFLRDLFVEVLGYTLKPDKDFNLVREFKNQTDGKKADGAIIKDEKAVAVIELKSTKTKDLTSITQQAFNYKHNQPGCKYVITSNFQKLRFYVDYSNEYEEFDLFNLQKTDFELLYLILRKDAIFNDLPQKLKDETRFHEKNISEQLYKDYSNLKNKIFENIVKNNFARGHAPLYVDKLTLFKKSQKLLDRLLFIFFAEDCGLLPANSISRIIDRYDQLIELDAYKPLYEIYLQYFAYMNIGRKGKIATDDIPAYNGGLFAADELLDNLKIDDKVLRADCLKLSAYDFNTDVDVNILGHIFEHSLNEIEEIAARGHASLHTSKRKKDGVFYTPKYITQYIVENTIGTLCTEKRKEMNIYEIEFDTTFFRKAKGHAPLSKKGKELFNTLNDYKKWLKSLKILDPACGSGAFLNQALQFLIAEHKLIDDLIADLTGDAIGLFDTDKSILENNLYGVDINEESVEIAKLSLWLRTARKDRKLSNLNDNIKCGNSLINDPEIAGDKAFDWNFEFKKIMDNGGFDVIIGNPPYVVSRSITDNVKSFYYKEYNSATYQINLYLLFIEKTLKLIKKTGIVSLIVPNTWLINRTLNNFREHLINHYSIEQIIDLTKVNVFADATVLPVIFIATAGKTKNIIIKEFINERYSQKNNLSINDLLRDNYLINYQNHVYLNKIFDKIEKQTVKLGEISKISFGVKFYQTGKGKPKQTKEIVKQKIFNHNEKTGKNPKKILEGKSIERYQVNWAGKWIEYGEWLAEPRNPELFEGERVLLRRIVNNRFTGTFVNENYCNNSLLHTIKITDNNISAKFLLAIINSSLFGVYFIRKFARDEKTFPEIRVSEVKMLPIKIILPKTQNKIIETVNKMLSLNKKLQTDKNNYLKTLQEEKSIEKLSKKLQNFHNLEYEEFKKELRKKKVKINLGAENNEWREYFNTSKEKINELQIQINHTDKEIDKMVYELYELTAEEIEIVENSVK